MGVDDTRRSRRGPSPLGAQAKRGHTVSVRLNPAELALLDDRRAGVRMQRGEYLRSAALHVLPPTVPKVNRAAWAALARTAANLNQIAHRMNAGHEVAFDELQAMVTALRDDLIGTRFDGKEDDYEGED